MARFVLGSLAAVALAGVIACGGGPSSPTSTPPTPAVPDEPSNRGPGPAHADASGPPGGTGAAEPAADGSDAARAEAADVGAAGPGSQVVWRELTSTVKDGRLWRNVVVPPATGPEALAALARDLHAEEPAACIRFFDDDSGFEAFRDWDEHYLDEGLRPPYPAAWAEEHYLANLVPMNRGRGLRWELDADGLKLMPPGGGPIAAFEPVDPEELRAASAAAIARTEPSRREAEQRRKAAEARKESEAEQRRRAAEEARERAAAAALAEALGAPGDLGTTAGIDVLTDRLDAVAAGHADTESAERAATEAAALAKLRLAYVWAQRPGADPGPRLRQVVKDHPRSLAARVARSRLTQAR